MMGYQPILFILTLLLSSNAFSEVNLTEKTTHYLVEPTSAMDMVRVFNKASPITKNGQIYLGNTNWKVWWEWKSRKKNSRCRVKGANAFVEIEFVIPKLKPRYYNSDVLFIWDKWFPRLMKHEKNHAKYALDIAKMGEKELMNLPSQKNCKVLNQMAEALTVELNTQLKNANKMYDIRTRHGKTEGADLGEYM